MSAALFLSGGAPNLSFMAGGLYELETLGVEYSPISTSGAGMLIGLLYAALAGDQPLEEQRLRALRNTLDMYVDDQIHDSMERFWFFPANYKVFHKPGAAAEFYTRFWQALPKAVLPNADLQRFCNNWVDLVLTLCCPTDLGPWSKGMCQPAPFIHQVADFSKLKHYPGDFVMNAYCLETSKIELFKKGLCCTNK